MQVSTKKRLILLTGEANRPLADEIADHLGMKLGVLETAMFADSQTYARLAESVRGADAFIIQSICDPVDHFIMQQLIVIDALKRASAKRITAVCPLYPYSRQDRKARGREPITAKLMADIYEAAGVNRMISVDLHSGQIQGFFDVPFDHLTAMPVLAHHFTDILEEGEFVIVSPDAGGVRLADKWVQHFAEFHDLHGQVAFLHKRRRKDVRNVSETKTVVGDVKGKICVVVDDMIDTAGTLVNGSDLLVEAGATKVYAAATHGILSGPAIDRIKNSQIEQVVVTNTLPLSPDKQIDKILTLSIAPLIGDTIQAVFEEDSVSNLFHGKNEP